MVRVFLWEEIMMVLYGSYVKPLVTSNKSKLPTRSFKFIIFLYLNLVNMVFMYFGIDAPNVKYQAIAPW